MTQRLSVQDLPHKYQEQVSAQIHGHAVHRAVNPAKGAGAESVFCGAGLPPYSGPHARLVSSSMKFWSITGVLEPSR